MSIWNSSPQHELATNPLSGKLGADQDPRDANGDNTIIQALTSQISHLKKQHRDQTQALHAALEQAHGENLQLRRELARLGWTGQPATT